jgi:hypothetical protein
MQVYRSTVSPTGLERASLLIRATVRKPILKPPRAEYAGTRCLVERGGFDKETRRKPQAFAADAVIILGFMDIQYVFGSPRGAVGA